MASIVIQEGNAVTVSMQWFTAAGLPEAPQTVVYRVYDYLTREPVCEERSVGPVSQDMTFSVLPEDLPASAARFRLLKVKIHGTFTSAEDPHTDYVDVSVERGY